MIVCEVVIAERRIVGGGNAKDGRATRPSAYQHGRKLRLRQPDASSALGDETVEGFDVLLQPSDDQIRAAVGPLGKVRRRRSRIELIFRRLTRFAQEELTRPDKLLPGFGQVQASRISRRNVAWRDVVARCGR